MRLTVFHLLFLFLFSGCQEKKARLLSAQREAPLGWVHLDLYADSSFDLVYSGLRSSDHYPGQFKLVGDSLFFYYSDSIPPRLQATEAIIRSTSVNYINGLYPESLQVTFNELKK